LLFRLSFRSAAEESASVVALAFAFLVVIPEGNLLLLLLFFLSFPKGICCLLSEQLPYARLQMVSL